MSDRAPRFERAPDQVGGLRLQERDAEIIRLVYEYRFLNSAQIQALVEGSDQNLLRRLQKLYHHGYLDRPPSQGLYPKPGLEKMVYGLGDRGADLLAERYGMDRGQVRWREKNREAGDRYLRHTLMVSDFRTCLTLALRQRDDAELLFWKREKQAQLSDEVTYRGPEGGKRRIPVVPDSFFGIEDPGGKMYFFLEADRSTMTNRRFLKKMRGYWKWWQQGGHREKYGIEAFRVLTVTKSEARKENLRETTRQADDRQDGSLMFWFTARDRYDLEEPERVLQPVWQTPRDDQRHGLLE